MYLCHRNDINHTAMSIIRLTKEFTFEAAHMLEGYDGLCREIHGHSYRLFVTVKGEPQTDADSPKLGMVMDFGILKRIVNEQIVDRLDHAFMMRRSERADDIIGLKARNLQDRDVHRLQKTFNVWHREFYILGRGGTVGLILRKHLATEASARRVKGYAYEVGLLSLEDVAQKLREAKYHGGVQPITIAHRSPHEGIVILEYQRISIDKI